MRKFASAAGLYYFYMRMAKKFREKLRRLNPFSQPMTPERLPEPLPANPDQRLVKVYVEGYEDVAFWRGIFDHFQNPYLRFEISVPDRGDLPKGKKVLMGMIPRSSEETILCVDSDFDYLFADRTPQSKEVNGSRFMFHTYAYATENYLCYAPSLHNVCVKATKNDTRIFDFVKFMREYSCTIYPLFLWYAYSAQLATENVFPLIDFKQSVRIGYLDIEDNGAKTIEWLRRNVSKRENLLRQRNPRMTEPMKEFEAQLRERGVRILGLDRWKSGEDLVQILEYLRQEAGCPYVLCEGGGRLGLSLLEAGLVDEFHLHIAPKVLGDNDARPLFDGRTPLELDEALSLRLVSMEPCGEDGHLIFRPVRACSQA